MANKQEYSVLRDLWNSWRLGLLGFNINYFVTVRLNIVPQKSTVLLDSQYQ